MRKIVLSLAVLAAILLPAFHAAPARAQNTQSWVSHSGSDNNNCLQASPCQGFFTAQGKTLPGGKISCLDAGAYAFFNTIQTSVTIDCTGTLGATTQDNGFDCGPVLTIIAPGATVTLRGLSFTGSPYPGCPTGGTRIGIQILVATAVYIEDCVIENFTQQGIIDQRTGGSTKLTIKNTIVRNNGGAGIVVAAAATNAVVLENVHSVGNTYGLAVATGNNVVINNSVMSQNSIVGIEVDSGAQAFIDSTEITLNVSYGIYARGNVTLANSDIAFNTTSINGSTLSFGNNKLYGNGHVGDTPTPISQQ